MPLGVALSNQSEYCFTLARASGSDVGVGVDNVGDMDEVDDVVKEWASGSDVGVGEKVESRESEYTEVELVVVVGWPERVMTEAVIQPEKKGTIGDLSGGCGRCCCRVL
ncbi:hypothetical protein RHSIM_Rhsim12G0080600 [Rhododendron simsii]|uniref:Uncharacterized protein n=1 Tax=Rhododendron simsii TaxID=118357 RepID=A0A834L988_RHOSS|nr:hypothetical protein RHSIM_Rhsim12G0080600 [Rhododendron simsii]